MSVYKNAQIQFQNAVEKMHICKSAQNILLTHKKIIEVSLPVVLDSGKIEVFQAYRVQHNDARGPMK